MHHLVLFHHVYILIGFVSLVLQRTSFPHIIVVKHVYQMLNIRIHAKPSQILLSVVLTKLATFYFIPRSL